jgi:hypothetical protein
MGVIIIQDEYKIGLISLAHAIDNKELTVTQAFKKAKEEYNFEGSIGDFIDTLRANGLIDREESVAKEVNNIANKKISLNKAMKYVALGTIGVALVMVIFRKEQ